MAEIFLERFAVKRIEKITVRLKSLTVIGVNLMRTGERLGKCRGRGASYTHCSAICWVGVCKNDWKHVLLILINIFHTYFYDKKVKPGITKQSYSF